MTNLRLIDGGKNAGKAIATRMKAVVSGRSKVQIVVRGILALPILCVVLPMLFCAMLMIFGAMVSMLVLMVVIGLVLAIPCAVVYGLHRLVQEVRASRRCE